MNVSDETVVRMRGEVMNMNSEMSTQRLTGTFRRNGKLQACEPCRKSKLRCDHVLPYCGRCAKRKRMYVIPSHRGMSWDADIKYRKALADLKTEPEALSILT